jgi:hypothetical protein
LEGKPPAAQIGNSKFKEVIMASPLQYKVYEDKDKSQREFIASFKSPWDVVIFALSISKNVTVKYGGRIVWNNHSASTGIGTFGERVRWQRGLLLKKLRSHYEQ